jgi:hypothetical protein
MEHFWQSIQGWAGGIDPVYHSLVASAEDGAHFVEVGSWRGSSSAYMCVEIANSGKKIRFDCVDTWRGSLDEEIHQTDPGVVNDTLFDEFNKNLERVRDYYTAHRMTSVEASHLYQDNSLDFVFIDAQHTYEAVLEDILAWLPKVKSGGILAGHDIFHIPVKKAVEQQLGTDYTDTGVCWIYAVK